MIERVVLEWQGLTGSSPDVDARESRRQASTKDGDGSTAATLAAPRGHQLCREGARATTDVERALARAHPGRGDQRARQLARVASHEAVVLLGRCRAEQAHAPPRAPRRVKPASRASTISMRLPNGSRT